MEEEPMMLHLEPGAYHLAEAIVDFLQSYSWKHVAIVLSQNIPGHETLEKELKRVQAERASTDHVKHFKWVACSWIFVYSFFCMQWSTVLKIVLSIKMPAKHRIKMYFVYGGVFSFPKYKKHIFGYHLEISVLFAIQFLWILPQSNWNEFNMTIYMFVYKDSQL